MSSEFSIHLGDKPVKGKVYDLSPPSGIMVTVDVEAPGNAEAGVRLFVPRDRLLEASLLFHKIAQDLAALLPDVDACCRCVPGTPDDQCAVHGFEAWLQGKVDADGDTIPREEAAEHVEPPHRWG